MGSRAANLAIALGSVVAVLAVGEALVRWLDIGPKIKVENRWLYQASDDPVLQYELRPGARDGAFRISDAGLRDRDFALGKPGDVFRIAAIGDSVTYGGDIERAHTFAKQLEWLLDTHRRREGPRFEVLNFGVSGYNVTQVAELLKVKGMAYEPDLILYGYTLNDPQEFSLEGQDILRRKQREARRTPPVTSPILHTLARSKLFLMAWQQVKLRRDRPDARRPKQPDPAYEALQSGDVVGYFRALHTSPGSAARLSDGLGEIASLARSGDAMPLLAVFPLFLETPDYPLGDVHDGVARIAGASGFTVVDLAPIYAAERERAGGDLSLDFLHPDDQGHRLAASAIFATLCEKDLVPENALDCSGSGRSQ